MPTYSSPHRAARLAPSGDAEPPACLASRDGLCIIEPVAPPTIRSLAPNTAPVPSVSGMAILDMLRTLEEMLGAEVYAQAFSQLAPQLTAALDELTAVSWMPVETLSRVLDEIARLSGREVEAMVDQTVRRSVDRTFKTAWRMLLRVTSDEAMIKRTPAIYARSRNVGELRAQMIGPQHAELELSGWSDVSDRQLRVLSVSIGRVLELSGRHDVTMTWARTAQGARYQLRWRT
jgi:hypothetical protein